MCNPITTDHNYLRYDFRCEKSKASENTWLNINYLSIKYQYQIRHCASGFQLYYLSWEEQMLCIIYFILIDQSEATRAHASRARKGCIIVTNLDSSGYLLLTIFYSGHVESVHIWYITYAVVIVYKFLYTLFWLSWTKYDICIWLTNLYHLHSLLILKSFRMPQIICIITPAMAFA